MKNNSDKEKIFLGKDRDTQQDWDIYWGKQDKPSNKTYDKFADFYRNNIIKKALNHFIFKYFQKGAKLLHAGCGSGKVDTDIVKNYRVTALDISYPALKIYDSVNQQKAELVQASIFEMPFADDTFDGLYNLGVLEHFTSEEIEQVLKECKRVIKPGGKICLFIPPTYGLTVQVLDTAHFVLNKILRKNVKLHPDEISRVKSGKQIRSVIENAGFDFVEYYFGIKDMFTQVVIVGEKK